MMANVMKKEKLEIIILFVFKKTGIRNNLICKKGLKNKQLIFINKSLTNHLWVLAQQLECTNQRKQFLFEAAENRKSKQNSNYIDYEKNYPFSSRYHVGSRYCESIRSNQMDGGIPS